MLTRQQLFAKWARLYFEAALAADERIGFLPGYEAVAPPPVMMNISHSIELSMKSFLLNQGLAPKDLKDIGHNLQKLWAETKKARPQLCDELKEHDDVVRWLSDQHYSQTYRYGEKSRLGRTPIFGPVQQLADRLLTLCGAPTFEELQ